ncbi:MAG: hypothetical protein AB1489_25785 [Acidobacteriota bacterium]
MKLRLIKIGVLLLVAVAVTVLILAPNGLADGNVVPINGSDSLAQDPPMEEEDPPEIVIGERLFLETRFAQFFFANANGDANKVLDSGDPVMDTSETLDAPLPGPFAGQSMNCRACHLVDEQQQTIGGGMRAYSDFARRTPLPARPDRKTKTVRNSPPLVNASLARNTGFFLHFDGEFTTIKDLVKATFTGRNYGWLPEEKQPAIAHIANIIRNDNGSGDLASEFGGAYRVILKGTDTTIPDKFRLPKKFRIDVSKATDKEILNAISALVAAYVESLVFAQDDNGEFNGSPYDLFLQKNSLPRKPAQGESDLAYSRRLLQLLQGLSSPMFVSEADGEFKFHSQAFVFGPQELEGLKIFLSEANMLPLPPDTLMQGKIGNCVACHAAPNFTDFRFHNTGATQEEYDAIHGQEAFANILIPDLKTRRANYDAFLPPTAKHPNAQGPFLDIPTLDKPGRTDLGLWNVFANPDISKPQKQLRQTLCDTQPCSARELLPKTIALFKTPGLRDLGHSAPYFHTGGKTTLIDVIEFYRKFGELARAGKIRNGAMELQGIALTPADVTPLNAFLKSLNEDYE